VRISGLAPPRFFFFFDPAHIGGPCGLVCIQTNLRTKSFPAIQSYGRTHAYFNTSDSSFRCCQKIKTGGGVGGAPPSKADTPYHTHLYGVKCTQHVDSQTSHGLSHIHPKIGGAVESCRRVRAADKPSGEPIRKGETQSPTVLGYLAS